MVDIVQKASETAYHAEEADGPQEHQLDYYGPENSQNVNDGRSPFTVDQYQTDHEAEQQFNIITEDVDDGYGDEIEDSQNRDEGQAEERKLLETPASKMNSQCSQKVSREEEKDSRKTASIYNTPQKQNVDAICNGGGLKSRRQTVSQMPPVIKDKKFDSTLLDRMSKIARQGLIIQKRQKSNAPGTASKRATEIIEESDDINYRYEKGWSLGQSVSKQHIHNLNIQSQTNNQQMYQTKFNHQGGLSIKDRRQSYQKQQQNSSFTSPQASRQNISIFQTFDNSQIKQDSNNKMSMKLGGTTTNSTEFFDKLNQTIGGSGIKMTRNTMMTAGFEPAPLKVNLLPELGATSSGPSFQNANQQQQLITSQQDQNNNMYSSKQCNLVGQILRRQLREIDHTAASQVHLQSQTSSRTIGAFRNTNNASSMLQQKTARGGYALSPTSNSTLMKQESPPQLQPQKLFPHITAQIKSNMTMTTLQPPSISQNKIQQQVIKLKDTIHGNYDVYDRMKQGKSLEAAIMTSNNQYQEDSTGNQAYNAPSHPKTVIKTFKIKSPGAVIDSAVKPQTSLRSSPIRKISTNRPFVTARKKSTKKMLSTFKIVDEVDMDDDDDLDKILAQTATVDQILSVQTSRFDVVKRALDKKRERRAQFNSQQPKRHRNEQQGDDGDGNYTEKMPDQLKLNQTWRGQISQKKQNLIKEIAKNSERMEGILSVNETHDKHLKQNSPELEQISQYAKNFSEIADMVDLQTKNTLPAMYHFANAIKMKAQENLVKISLKHGLEEKMFKVARRRGSIDLPGQRKNQLESLFQKASNEDHSTVQTKANEFIQRMHYYEKFKKRDMDDDINNHK